MYPMKKLSLISVIVVYLVTLFACQSANKNNEEKNGHSQKTYFEKGDEIIKATQKELINNVSAAIKKGGPTYAIEFCNIKAMEITDSLSKKFNCSIERISFKNRNPKNQPDTYNDKEQLTKFEETHQAQEELHPTVIITEESAEYYKPIFVSMETCLQCHGTKETGLKEKTVKKLAELYPNDKATGYKLNDLRGAWKITFYR